MGFDFLFFIFFKWRFDLVMQEGEYLFLIDRVAAVFMGLSYWNLSCWNIALGLFVLSNLGFSIIFIKQTFDHVRIVSRIGTSNTTVSAPVPSFPTCVFVWETCFQGYVIAILFYVCIKMDEFNNLIYSLTLLSRACGLKIPTLIMLNNYQLS